jgi:ATP-dependent RNA helicase DDX51/DBP6
MPTPAVDVDAILASSTYELLKADSEASLTRRFVLDPEDTLPLEKAGFLGRKMKKILKKSGVTELFPVQKNVCPAILDVYASKHRWEHCGQGSVAVRDFCVAAPTGSGKTLSYVLPMCEALRSQSAQSAVKHIAALVVVPTRDLALQAAGVMAPFCEAFGLKSAVLMGHQSFEQERGMLYTRNGSDQVACLVDIVIATPGRLVDHLEETKEFDLSHLEFLVVDEVDRLLKQHYSGWLASVLDAVSPAPLTVGLGAASLSLAPVRPSRLPIKILLSATFSTNPESMGLLQLQNPWTFVASSQKKYKIPGGLREVLIVCPAERKPLGVLFALQHVNNNKCICFASSKITANRLSVALSEMGRGSVANYKADLPNKSRQALLQSFATGILQVLVCSDSLSRGLDVQTEAVVSYDLPLSIKSYLHRAGRTARANRQGIAFTIVDESELPAFQMLLKKAERPDNAEIEQWTLPADFVDEHWEAFEQAVGKLAQLEEEE